MTQGIKQWLYKASAAEMLKATKRERGLEWHDCLCCKALYFIMVVVKYWMLPIFNNKSYYALIQLVVYFTYTLFLCSSLLQPLQSMPESLPSAPANNYYEDEEEMEYDSDGSPPGSLSRHQHLRHRSASGSRSRPHSRISGGSGGAGDRASSSHSRPGSGITLNSSNNLGGPRPLSQSMVNGVAGGGGHRSRSVTRAATTNKLTALQRSNVVSVCFHRIVVPVRGR